MGWALEDVSVEGSTDGRAVLARGNGRLAMVSLCSDGGLDRFPAITLCSVLTSTRVIRDKQPVGKTVWDPHGYCTMEGCPRRIRYPTCHAQLLLQRRILLVAVVTSQPWKCLAVAHATLLTYLSTETASQVSKRMMLPHRHW